MLLDTCKGYLEKGVGCGSDKDVVLVVSPLLETSMSRSELVDNVSVLNDLHLCDRMEYFDTST